MGVVYIDVWTCFLAFREKGVREYCIYTYKDEVIEFIGGDVGVFLRWDYFLKVGELFRYGLVFLFEVVGFFKF